MENNDNNFFDEEDYEYNSPSMDSVKSAFKHLNLPWKRSVVLAWIYGDDKKLPERIFPDWIDEVPEE